MLYNKKLNSIAELQAERLALKSAEKRIKVLAKQKEVNGNDELVAKKITALTSFLIGNSKYADILNTATEIVLPYLLKEFAAKKARKKLVTIVTEVGVGYAKWKAMSLFFGIIFDAIKKKRK